MSKSEFRRTTAAVNSPIRDKRVKYGEESIDGLLAGVAFVYSPAVTPEGQKYPLPAYIELAGGQTINRPEFIEAVLTASEPSKPATAKEVAMQLEGRSVGDWALAGALQRLYESGAISEDALRAALVAELDCED